MGYFTSDTTVRPPAVAGLFYPDDAQALRSTVERLLADAHPSVDLPAPPKALIVPHAGYVYSGPVAAAAYSLLVPLRRRIERVVLIGPSHRVYLRGIALPQALSFATPLGEVSVDSAGGHTLLKRGDVLAADAPHELEHSLEVQLPFLQSVLDDFALLPLVVGSATPEYVASVLRDVWGGPETLILASSDLSHYLSYKTAQATDAATAKAIVNRDTHISHEQACGAIGINGLMLVARELELAVAEIARQNSGDTAGDKHRVVGYGAYALYEPARSVS